MTWFLFFVLIAAVLFFGYFVVRHKDDFERLFRSDVEKVRDEAKEAEDKFRAAMRKFDDEARESLAKKVKKIRARRK
jgi:TRAP-type C4-dicarboxylate transport system substrate-binding protein